MIAMDVDEEDQGLSSALCSIIVHWVKDGRVDFVCTRCYHLALYEFHCAIATQMKKKIFHCVRRCITSINNSALS